jgi:hypothetical protein
VKPGLPQPPAIWTSPQRRVLIVLLLALLGYLAGRFALNPVYVSRPQPRVPPRYFDLADRIDPNEADWQTLAALPNIGEKRAKDVVAYREKFLAADPARQAFSRAEDLFNIKGFGPAIVLQLRPYLIFPKSPSTTSAAS